MAVVVTYPLVTGIGANDPYGLLALAPVAGNAYDLLGVNSAGDGYEFKSLLHASSARFWIGDTQYNACVSIDNPDATGAYAALVVKHGDGLGNHSNILEIKDQTAITNYISVSYTGQITAQNITMANLFDETIFKLEDLSVGASMWFSTTYADPAVPGDGFKMYSNPLGGGIAFVDSSSQYVQYDLTGAGADSANATTLAMPSAGASAARLELVGEYFNQPVLNKRLGAQITAVATAGTPFNAAGTTTSGGVTFTGSTAFIVHGFLAPDTTYSSQGRSGHLCFVRNVSTAIGTIKHNSGTAAAADRVMCPGGVDMYLMPSTGMIMSYNSGSSLWYVISMTQCPSGVWTPTGTNVANIAAKTFYECQYSYDGKTVNFSGKISIDPTAGAVLTQLRITKPIASNFGAEEDAGGVGFSDDVFGLGFRIQADAASDDLLITYIADAVAANSDFSFSGSYEVI